jgi:hypothetical protein
MHRLVYNTVCVLEKLGEAEFPDIIKETDRRQKDKSGVTAHYIRDADRLHGFFFSRYSPKSSIHLHLINHRDVRIGSNTQTRRLDF